METIDVLVIIGLILMVIFVFPFVVFCILSFIFGRDKNKLKKEDWKAGYREK